MKIKLFMLLSAALFLLFPAFSQPGEPQTLPARYFWLMSAGSDDVAARLDGKPGITFEELEKEPGSRHFPFTILAPAVLYSKRHSTNKRFHDPKMLALAIRLGDMMAVESEKGTYEERADSDWETYMWLETYRLLIKELGETRKERWKRELLKNIHPLEEECLKRINFAWYNTPYTGTSPNHYSIYASIVYLAGKVFNDQSWQKLGARILRRFAITEQTADGFWGELVNASPTIGYNHLTLTSVSVYWEHSHDTAVLPALRRATTFHKHFTYPNGEPVETMNDRNRHWGVSPWAHFAFTNFPDGRRYAQFLAGFFNTDMLPMDVLGRMAQNALYYHEGSQQPIPQDQKQYLYQAKVPAAINKNGKWITAISGLISPQAILNQFYLDRQAHLSIYHNTLGQVISGANSKRQPELGTFFEKLSGKYYSIPISSRLNITSDTMRLSLGYNTFFSDLYVPVKSTGKLPFYFVISGMGRPAEEAALNLQLCLKAGETLETATGQKFVLGTDKIELTPAMIGGWIKHNGWTLHMDEHARITWPVYPYQPYGGEPHLESDIKYAIGALSVPLSQKELKGSYVRPNEQIIEFVLEAD
ncbi:MAG: hypothetical protein JNK79_10885 [Chitinophagaceae bacterium]|nr:hypothetical protein [Chitinophagaceae bacterium]